MIISNYIFKQTLRNVVVSTMVFISVVWLSQSFKTIKLIINKGAGISDFMILSAYSFPSWLLIALPFGMFAGSMISYIRLENDKEIVVMKAAGISFMGVSSPAIIIAVIAVIWLMMIICSGAVWFVVSVLGDYVLLESSRRLSNEFEYV